MKEGGWVWRGEGSYRASSDSMASMLAKAVAQLGLGQSARIPSLRLHFAQFCTRNDFRTHDQIQGWKMTFSNVIL
jgi:hypothetical protein